VLWQLLSVTLVFSPLLLHAGDEPVIDIPKATGTEADPSWVKTAYRADVLKPVGDKDPAHSSLALAWNEKGILIHIATNDSTPIEARDLPTLWNGDSFEVFVGSLDAADYFQLCITPGRTPVADEPRILMTDKRAQKPAFEKPLIHVEEKSETGYAMSVLIPWSNLQKPPTAGDIIRLQVHWNDGLSEGTRVRRIWYPKVTWDMEPSYHVRLAMQASPAQTAIGNVSVDRQWNVRLRVLATAELAGKAVQVTAGGQKADCGVMKAGGPDGSELSLALPAGIAAKNGGGMEVSVGGIPLAEKFIVPDPSRGAQSTPFHMQAGCQASHIRWRDISCHRLYCTRNGR